MNGDAEGDLTVRFLGTMRYQPVWEAMQRFTNARSADTRDEIWMVEHHRVFTQGQAGKQEHLLNTGDIPVIQVDRGGQVTYHGPGQLVAYLLIDLKRHQLGVRDLVTAIETAIVRVLAEYKILAGPRTDAPGVYIEPVASGAKIAQLGLRVRRGCCFHGLSINVDMDLEPFLRINPCGHIGLEVTSVKEQVGVAPSTSEMAQTLLNHLVVILGYNDYHVLTDKPLP